MTAKWQYKWAYERVSEEVRNLRDENTKLKRFAKLDDSTISALNACIDDLNVENLKLRELMHDTYDCICEMYRYMDGRYAYEDAEADDAYGPILKRMRDLGIEVGDAKHVRQTKRV